MKIKNCALIYNPKTANFEEIKNKASQILYDFEIEHEMFSINDMKKSGAFDIAFVIGGDGTILKSARFFSDTNTPIFGINSGRLGFLSQTTIDNFHSSIQKIFNDKFRIENRLMLESQNMLALNDFVIKNTENGKASRFQVKINGLELCNYLADGIIVSTPTGSTAYCLSANGPVLSPQLEALVIVPICPHTLSARPLVVPAYEKISISSTSASKQLAVYIDGHTNCIITDEITVKTASKRAKLLILQDKEFYKLLQTKLNWGTEPK